MIKIFCANIDSFSERDYLLMSNMVDLERNKKALKYLQKEDYKRCILGGMLLLFSIYHVKKKIIIPEIYKGDIGKPYVKNINAFHYNISHSGNWVVLATSSYEIGVDIEEIREHREIIQNMHFIFSEKEIHYVNQSKNEQYKINNFIKLWTIKESYLKYKGIGLSDELNSFCVIQNDSGDSNFINGVISKRVFEDYYLSVYSEKETECDEIVVNSYDYEVFSKIYYGCGENIDVT